MSSAFKPLFAILIKIFLPLIFLMRAAVFYPQMNIYMIA